tara:strand:+ start:2117 stop:2527 length:411 start_codon:yes stop_codon:yes gene_type:complete
MKNYKKIYFLIYIIFTFSFLLANITLAAGTFEQVNTGFGETGEAAGFPNSDGVPTNTFTQAWGVYVTNFAAGVGAAFFMVLIIYAGWLWMTAQGKEDQVERAKKIIIGSLIGLTIIIAGRMIAELVIYTLGTAIGQ